MEAFRRIQTGKTGDVHMVAFKDTKILDDTTLDEIRQESHRRGHAVEHPAPVGAVQDPQRDECHASATATADAGEPPTAARNLSPLDIRSATGCGQRAGVARHRW